MGTVMVLCYPGLPLATTRRGAWAYCDVPITPQMMPFANSQSHLDSSVERTPSKKDSFGA